MPYSSTEGKAWAADWLRDKQVSDVVDVGPGAGAWADTLKPVFPRAYWTAVEIWGPYVEQFHLTQKYNDVIVADVRFLDWSCIGSPDLVIFGDVLEHMDNIDAGWLVEKACETAKYTLISIPIIEYPQGAEMGNPYEAHVADYRHRTVLETLIDESLLLDCHLGETVGTYILRGYAE